MTDQSWKSRLKTKWEAEVNKETDLDLQARRRKHQAEYMRQYRRYKMTHAQREQDQERRRQRYFAMSASAQNSASAISNQEFGLVSDREKAPATQKFANVTAEMQDRKRHQIKVNNLKQKLRKQLIAKGELSSEEIKTKLRELHEKMWLAFDPDWSWECFGRGKGKRMTYKMATKASSVEQKDNRVVGVAKQEFLAKNLEPGKESNSSESALKDKPENPFPILKNLLLMKEDNKLTGFRQKTGNTPKRYRDQPEEYKKRMYQLQKNWLQNLTPEARKRHDETKRRSKFKWWARRAGENPETTDKTMYQLTKLYWERVKIENPEKWEQHQQTLNKTRTPEQRQRRLYIYRVDREKRKLRKQLESEGKLGAQEIQAKLKTLQDEMWLAFDPNSASKMNGKRKTPAKFVKE